MKPESFFEPFRKLQEKSSCFYVNEYTLNQWEDSKRKYEGNLRPCEESICVKLQKEIF
jgi:hypothetical protein